MPAFVTENLAKTMAGLNHFHIEYFKVQLSKSFYMNHTRIQRGWGGQEVKRPPEKTQKYRVS